MTTVHFVRHAQPEHERKEDRTRALTEQEKKDSAIVLNFYDNSFGCEDILRIIDWMPYIIELVFESNKFLGKHEHCYVEKEFKGKQGRDKK